MAEAAQVQNLDVKKPDGIERRLMDRIYPTALLRFYSNGGQKLSIFARKGDNNFQKHHMDNMKDDARYVSAMNKIALLYDMHTLAGEKLQERIKEITR